MTASNALTSISGTNGYQQHVAIDPSRPLTLSITNASGEIRVSSSDGPDVWVVVRRADGQVHDEESDIPVKVQVEDNAISIHPDWSRAGGFGALAKKLKDQLQHGFNPGEWNLSNLRLGADLNYDIRVQVPRALAEGSKVTARTASGAVSVNDLNAAVTIATASGAAEVRSVRGNTSIHTASGSIVAERITGALEANSASGSVAITESEGWTALRTVSGSIRFDRATMRNARIVTVSGSVKGNLVADNAQEYAFETVSGSVKIEVALPAGAQSRLSFKSLSGSVHAGGAWNPDGKRSWVAGHGPAGPAFSVKTVSGSFKAEATLDSGITVRHDPLPSPDAPPVDVEMPGTGEPGELERGIEAATAWVKDFAKNFASPPPGTPEGATPPPGTPAAPAPPAPPQAPEPPTAPEAPEAVEEMDASSTRAATPPNTAEPVDTSGAGSPSRPTANASATDTAPITPVQPSQGSVDDLEGTDAERLRVLEALERGEIDVDEALSRLDSEESRA